MAKQTTVISNYPRARCTPLPNDCSRLDHQTPLIWWLRLYHDGHRSWLHQSNDLHPMQRNYGNGRDGRTIHKKCHSTLWTPKQNHLQQRSPLNCRSIQRTLPYIRSQVKHEYSLSSPNWWTIRTNKQNTWNIPLNLLQLPIKQLG